LPSPFIGLRNIVSTIPTSAYSENRAAFSLEQLLPYEGQWVAFSADGSRVIAADREIARLLERVAAAGEDPQQIVLEKIVFDRDDAFLGGAEQ
jgi:hypothetical protein